MRHHQKVPYTQTRECVHRLRYEYALHHVHVHLEYDYDLQVLRLIMHEFLHHLFQLMYQILFLNVFTDVKR